LVAECFTQESEAAQQYRRLFEEAPVAYHEIDTDGTVIRVNHTECDLLGFTAAEMIGQPIWKFLVADDQTASRQRIARKMWAPEPIPPSEREFVRRDGVVLTLEVYENRILDHAARVVGIRTTMLDITQRKHSEEALAQRTAELMRSNAELEQFAYVASHDLQEPLRMVSSYTQLLARRYQGTLGSDADEFIAFAVDGAKRMQALINDLLVYSRVGTHAGKFQAASSERALGSALANLRAAIEESGAVIHRGPLPVVFADPLQLSQLLQNLIGNAIKYRDGAPPEINVACEDAPREWRFSVRDNGIGIDPKYAVRIFQVFQRLHNKKDYPGTGIGLAICKKIAERHGGRIWVESLPGQGATFCFTIRKGEGDSK